MILLLLGAFGPFVPGEPTPPVPTGGSGSHDPTLPIDTFDEVILVYALLRLGWR